MTFSTTGRIVRGQYRITLSVGRVFIRKRKPVLCDMMVIPTHSFVTTVVSTVPIISKMAVRVGVRVGVHGCTTPDTICRSKAT
jgi:hypothetical protein